MKIVELHGAVIPILRSNQDVDDYRRDIGSQRIKKKVIASEGNPEPSAPGSTFMHVLLEMCY